jgi:hypothetical protein
LIVKPQVIAQRRANGRVIRQLQQARLPLAEAELL